MAKREKPPPPPPRESRDVLLEELRRRGMSEAEIEAALRKRKRRAQLDLAARLPTHGLVPGRPDLKARPARYEPPSRPADELCTVDFAAGRLQLHPKTVLRFIRDGRLPAKRIGKSYRIRRADLDALAGAPAPVVEARVSAVVDVEPVGRERAQWWMQAVPAALQGRAAQSPPLRADLVYDPDAARLKIILVGPPGDVAGLFALFEAWLANDERG